MTSETKISIPDTRQFLSAVSELTASLGWQHQSFTRDEEFIVLTVLENDPSFEQVLWIYDVKRVFLRCLLINRGIIPSERESAIVELCARINEGLAFGCAEYSFDDHTVIFRDSADLKYGSLADLIMSTSTRLLSLGSRYAPAIRATLAGSTPLEVM
jgi:hypothetical protein